ncbi:preprotein translocase subunit YajC [Peijinzhouia sedimentorum]|tara:strand:- start:561 stop:878 length:318 start_codon:yes stop_codon:yes gene_type:complete
MNAFILAQAGGGDWMGQLLLWGGIILVFYFFMIRPQQKKQKDQKSFSESLTKGAMVVTIGGLHGKVLTVEDTTVTLEVDKGTRMVFEKSAISLDSSKQYMDTAKK